MSKLITEKITILVFFNYIISQLNVNNGVLHCKGAWQTLMGRDCRRSISHRMLPSARRWTNYQLFAVGGERARSQSQRCRDAISAEEMRAAKRRGTHLLWAWFASALSLAYRVTPLRGNKSKTPAPDREITTASLATVGINSTHTQKTNSRPAGPKKLRRWILIDLPMGEI